MKKVLITIAVVLLSSLCAFSQTFDIYESFDKHPEYLFGTDMLCPTGEVPLTAAPAGYKPFYISHYGRHGARYAWQDDIYDWMDELLSDADAAGNLTDYGKEFKRRFDILYPSVRYRIGELSRIGWEQQKDLAERMYENFPKVFKKDAKVTSYTSTSTRCVMTMSAFCMGLKEMDADLDIFENFGVSFLPGVLPLNDSNPFKEDSYEVSPLLFTETWDQYIARKIDSRTVLSRIFKDVDKALPEGDLFTLTSYLYYFVNGMESLDSDLDFTDVFTREERIALWEIDSFQFYTEAWPGHKGYQPVVDDIIAKADKMISEGGNGADLRFGHDYTILPLLMILGVDGFDHNCVSGDEIPYWCQVNRVPMGASLQLVFYHSKKDSEIIFKVLFNGEEAHLPLETDNWPYYSWSSFKAAFGRNQ